MSDAEHRLAEVGADEGGVGAGALEGEGEVAASGGEVEDSGGSTVGDEADGLPAPEHIETEAEQVVCKIVALGDAGEIGPHVGGLDGSLG